ARTWRHGASPVRGCHTVRRPRPPAALLRCMASGPTGRPREARTYEEDDMSSYRTENPTTGEVERTFDALDRDGAIAAVDRAHAAHEQWRATPVEQRADVLRRTADLYEERVDELARTIAVEMGKPLAEAKGEVQLAASIYRWYADHGPQLLQ